MFTTSTTQNTRIGFPHPTPEEMLKIKKFSNAEPHQVVVVEITAADNLMNRGRGKWSKDSLLKLAMLAPGITVTLDHDWENINKVQGRVFDAKYEEEEPPYNELAKAGNFELNSWIVGDEGYAKLELKAIIPVDSPILESLWLGTISYVSLGNFTIEDLWCPLCDCSFYDDKCPHLIPSLVESDTEITAPFYIRKGSKDLGEVSLVLIPNLPGAKVELPENCDY
jgi:hypothetical protein